MIHRGWFRIRYLSLSLILSCPPVFTGDGTVSLIKTVGTWALKTVAKVAGAAIAGHAAQQYNANNFDVDTGTFGIPSAVTENRGLPVGLQNSTTYETPAEARAQREYDRLPREQQVAQSNKYWEDKSRDFTQRELDYWIKTEDSLIKSAQDEATYRKRKGQMDQVRDNETRVKEYEVTKGILEKEKANRQPRGKIIRQLSDGSLKKLLRNSKEELAFAQQQLAAEGKRWFPDEQKVADNQMIEKNLQVTINQIEREQKARTQQKTIHTASTAMVLTSKTAGTGKTTTTQMEKVPEKGKELPVYEPEIVDKVPAVKGYDLVGGGKGPDRDPEDEKIKKIVTTATVGVAVEEAVRQTLTPTQPQPASNSQQSFREHEAKQFEANQKQMKEARKAELAKMNNDRQPFHEKGIEPKFPDNPGQKDHQFDNRKGHFAERTPNAEKTVKDTIKAEHFDYVDEHGTSRYTAPQKNGDQVWAEVRPDGTIKNCGVNDIPWEKNPDTGRYIKPANWNKSDPGKYYGIGAGVGASLLTSDSNTQENSSMSSETISKIKNESFNPLVAEKIRKSENPFTLPAAPKDSVSLVSQSPEMKAIINKQAERYKSMTPEQIIKEVSKPMTSPLGSTTITIPSYKPTVSTGIPSSFKTGTSTPSVLSSTKTAPPMMPASRPSTPSTSTLTGKVSAPSSKPASIPSAPRSSSSSSAPRITYSAPTSTSTGGKSYITGGPTGFKRN